MHIVMVSAECAPIAKAGGLGDFIPGLSRALGRLGETVEIMLPFYDVVPRDRIEGLRRIDCDLRVPYHDRSIRCEVSAGSVDGLNCILFDADSPEGFFRRGCIYGEPDDAERFAFFSSAVLEFMRCTGRNPDIIHCHDWQAGLVPVLLFERDQDRGPVAARVCYTLHNLGYQGVVPEAILRQVGLDPERLMVPDRLLDPSAHRAANLMKGGIVFANFVNTVSPRYAWEVRFSEQGMGLQSLLQQRARRFCGILNGIDETVWNPETDPLIPVRFGPESLPLKARNRALLRRRLGLRERLAPIVAVISRLDHQKGVTLMEYGIDATLALGGQFVLLGSALDPVVAERFERKRQALAGNPDCHLELRYDERLAHLIYAGADIILIPSRYEPCGLTQMIAMKYGVVPIVRRVGGLADTVFDANYSDQPFERRNGYLFDDLTEADLADAMGRALALWRDHPHYFRQLRINGMATDHSWASPAQRYRELYQRVRSV